MRSPAPAAPALKQKLLVVWAAMLASPLVYVALFFVVRSALPSSGFAPQLSTVLRPLLLFLALGSACAGWLVVPRRLTPDRLRELGDRSRAQVFAFQTIVISLALLDWAALLGFASAVITGHLIDLYAGCAVSLVAISLQRSTLSSAVDALDLLYPRSR